MEIWIKEKLDIWGVQSKNKRWMGKRTYDWKKMYLSLIAIATGWKFKFNELV